VTITRMLTRARPLARPCAVAAGKSVAETTRTLGTAAPWSSGVPAAVVAVVALFVEVVREADVDVDARGVVAVVAACAVGVVDVADATAGNPSLPGLLSPLSLLSPTPTPTPTAPAAATTARNFRTPRRARENGGRTTRQRVRQA